MDTRSLRTLVGVTCDVTKLRNRVEQRIVGNIKIRNGATPEQAMQLSLQERRVLLIEMDCYLSKEGVPFYENMYISTREDSCLYLQRAALITQERACEAQLVRALDTYPVWTLFLKGLRGVSPILAGILLSELDIHRAYNQQSFCTYVGLSITDAGSYWKKSTPAHPINVLLQNALRYTLVPHFLKAKNKYVAHFQECDMNNTDAYNRTADHMIAHFLTDLYFRWCEIENISTPVLT